MAENRMIRTKIWSDDWFSELTADAKLLYFFVLTNKNTHICGYYQTSLKEIEFFTGMNKKRVVTAFEEMQSHVDYVEDWVCIKNYARYQNVSNNEKVQKLIEKEMKNVPEHVLNSNSNSNSNSEAMDSLSTGYQDKAKNIEGGDKGVEKDVEKVRKKYGEFKNVALSDEEKEKIKKRYGIEASKALVEELSVGIKSKGYVYKDHYATLLSWARKKGLTVVASDKPPKMVPEEQPDGTIRLIPNPEYHE